MYIPLLLTLFTLVCSIAYHYRHTILDRVLDGVVLFTGTLLRDKRMIYVVSAIQMMMGTRVDVCPRAKLVHYSTGTHSYVIPLPFNRRAKSSSVRITREDGTMHEYDLVKGAPFPVTASDIGCESITIVGYDGKEVTYSGDEVVVV